jgi:hypothetical protein
MKVIEDKIAANPPHAICKVDVPVIVSAVPKEWIEGIKTIRLCSSQNENPAIVANFLAPCG